MYSLIPPTAGTYTVTSTQTFGTWTSAVTNSFGPGTSTLNDASAPTSLTLTSSAPNTSSLLTLTNTALSAGTLSFSYVLSGSDGYLVGGNQTFLSASSGTVSGALTAGQSFGFFSNGYFSTSTLTISNFSGPVPEPGAAGWIAAGAAGLLATRALRRRAAAARALLPA